MKTSTMPVRAKLCLQDSIRQIKNVTTTRIKTSLSLITFLCLYISSYGQNIQPLTIGDTIPDISFSHVLNYKTDTTKLSNFKSKLTILDFWATWCTSCIQGIPKMDSLQTAFNGDLQVLLINPKISGDSVGKIIRTVERINKSLNKQLSIPIIIYDTSATRLFKFQLVPHYVWVNEKGIIIAITHKDQITEANIRKAINEQQISLPVKNDFLQQ